MFWKAEEIIYIFCFLQYFQKWLLQVVKSSWKFVLFGGNSTFMILFVKISFHVNDWISQSFLQWKCFFNHRYNYIKWKLIDRWKSVAILNISFNILHSSIFYKWFNNEIQYALWKHCGIKEWSRSIKLRIMCCEYWRK